MQGEIKAQRIGDSPTEIFAHIAGTCDDTLINDSQVIAEHITNRGFVRTSSPQVFHTVIPPFASKLVDNWVADRAGFGYTCL